MTIHRLPPQPGEVIDRTRTLHFTWNGRRFPGHPGDTIVSALAASGERVFSRSFAVSEGACVTTGRIMMINSVRSLSFVVEPKRGPIKGMFDNFQMPFRVKSLLSLIKPPRIKVPLFGTVT